jgi:hypothetical protein
MRYFVFVGLFIFGLISCKTNTKLASSLVLPKEIKVKTLHAANFAEQMLGLGSMSDEVILFIFEDTGENHLYRWSSPILIFDKSEKVHPIPFQTKVKPGDIFNFLLLELDTERTTQELLSLVQKCDYPWTDDCIKKTIKDDDLLGFKQLKIQPMAGELVLDFWGVHLLDEYQYILSFN